MEKDVREKYGFFFFGSRIPKPLVLDRTQAALPLAVRETA